MTAPSESTGFKVAFGPRAEGARPELVWLHGWGHDHRHLLALARLFEADFNSTLYDLPGFGQTPRLEAGAGTERYAAWLARELSSAQGPLVLIGHSFGCRVALRFAVRHPKRVAGLVLIAAPGLPRPRSAASRVKAAVLKGLGKVAGLADRLFKTRFKEGYRTRFGSRDYRTAGPLRETLVATVNEDLSETAKAVAAPALLIYGERDEEAPPELGRRYQALMPRAQHMELPGLDHYNVLTRGAFRCEHAIRGFLTGLGEQ
jgi:pimeloyl-ACP methyl ester carboxylesterase